MVRGNNNANRNYFTQIRPRTPGGSEAQEIANLNTRIDEIDRKLIMTVVNNGGNQIDLNKVLGNLANNTNSGGTVYRNSGAGEVANAVQADLAQDQKGRNARNELRQERRDLVDQREKLQAKLDREEVDKVELSITEKARSDDFGNAFNELNSSKDKLTTAEYNRIYDQIVKMIDRFVGGRINIIVAEELEDAYASKSIGEIISNEGSSKHAEVEKRFREKRRELEVAINQLRDKYYGEIERFGKLTDFENFAKNEEARKLAKDKYESEIVKKKDAIVAEQRESLIRLVESGEVGLGDKKVKVRNRLYEYVSADFVVQDVVKSEITKVINAILDRLDAYNDLETQNSLDKLASEMESKGLIDNVQLERVRQKINENNFDSFDNAKLLFKLLGASALALPIPILLLSNPGLIGAMLGSAINNPRVFSVTGIVAGGVSAFTLGPRLIERVKKIQENGKKRDEVRSTTRFKLLESARDNDPYFTAEEMQRMIPLKESRTRDMLGVIDSSMGELKNYKLLG